MDWLTGWLADWLTDWLAGWLIDWLTNFWLIGWLISWVVDWLTERLTDRSTDWVMMSIDGERTHCCSCNFKSKCFECLKTLIRNEYFLVQINHQAEVQHKIFTPVSHFNRALQFLHGIKHFCPFHIIRGASSQPQDKSFTRSTVLHTVKFWLVPCRKSCRSPILLHLNYMA